jgi:CubicO group peptidase (beta-lactamase class C family)
MGKPLIPDTVTMVARRGRIIHFDVQGYQNVEKHILWSMEAIFRVASMTKPITSVALMMLYEEGIVWTR